MRKTDRRLGAPQYLAVQYNARTNATVGGAVPANAKWRYTFMY
jgi:hypothetical protein